MQIHLIEHVERLITQRKGLLIKPNLRKVEQEFHVSIFHIHYVLGLIFYFVSFLTDFGEGSTSHNHQ